MKNAIGNRCMLEMSSEGRPVSKNSARIKTVEQVSILDWYRTLRVHCHWPLFEAIRYALWLSR